MSNVSVSDFSVMCHDSPGSSSCHERTRCYRRPKGAHVCSMSPSCLLTKVLLQEGQDGPHHNLLTFVRVQGPTSVTGKEFSKQVAGHESKVSLTPMNSSARDKEKRQVGRRVEVGHTCVPTMCKVLPVCSVVLPATLSGKYFPCDRV